MEDIKKSEISGISVRTWLSEEVVRLISRENWDPDWMLDLRLRALETFHKMHMPKFWPDLSGLDLSNINYFGKTDGTSKDSRSWDDVPEHIRSTFEKLWIPEAEREFLAWVWAQFDSEVVYHSMKKEYEDLWIIFEDMSQACSKYPEIVKSHFMKAVPISDHKFASLHASCWSWWTFLYIPDWVKLDEPLQSYFRMNLKAWWQFEHTMIILWKWSEAHYIEWCSAPKYKTPSLHAGCVEIYIDNQAKLRYSSVENWSEDTYNLNTKRAIIQEEWSIEWVWWNMWAWVTMLYPCSVLVWDRSSSSHLWVAFANDSQIIDAGAKVIHIWKQTTSVIKSKSISKWGWSSIYRWFVEIKESAKQAVSKTECDWLLLDSDSSSLTVPFVKSAASDAVVAHEASAWRISEEHLFYLQSRWISEDEAEAMVINWFLSPVVKELPLEYASEMNALISMELQTQAKKKEPI